MPRGPLLRMFSETFGSFVLSVITCKEKPEKNNPASEFAKRRLEGEKT